MSERMLRSLTRGRAASRPVAMLIFGLLIALVGGACSGGAGGGSGGGVTTITLAAVDNPSMADLKQLVPDFQASHPNIQVKIVTLPEDMLQQHVTHDVAENIGRYVLFKNGNYEVRR